MTFGRTSGGATQGSSSEGRSGATAERNVRIVTARNHSLAVAPRARDQARCNGQHCVGEEPSSILIKHAESSGVFPKHTIETSGLPSFAISPPQRHQATLLTFHQLCQRSFVSTHFLRLHRCLATLSDNTHPTTHTHPRRSLAVSSPPSILFSTLSPRWRCRIGLLVLAFALELTDSRAPELAAP